MNLAHIFDLLTMYFALQQNIKNIHLFSCHNKKAGKLNLSITFNVHTNIKLHYL